MDVKSPAEFTAARDEYVAKARKAGDRELAAAIAALRKPTVAAWTAGLLARRRPKEAQSLVQLGEALRTAHRTLDAGQLRQLSHDQHVVIQRLARTARALAVEAGQAVTPNRSLTTIGGSSATTSIMAVLRARNWPPTAPRLATFRLADALRDAIDVYLTEVDPDDLSLVLVRALRRAEEGRTTGCGVFTEPVGRCVQEGLGLYLVQRGTTISSTDARECGGGPAAVRGGWGRGRAGFGCRRRWWSCCRSRPVRP